jgi:(p)ppGpp synthase/HD superfamily hydrolase
MKTLEQTMIYAITKHAGQKDRSGNPYIFHPIRVAYSVIEYGEEYAQAGLLHDVIEDCGVSTEQLLSEGFSPTVVEAVSLLSRPAPGTENRPTYSEFIEKIRDSKNEIAIELKIADLNDNLRRIDSLPPEEQDIRHRYEKALKILHNY